MDIAISLTPDQIQFSRSTMYDPSKPLRVVLNSEIYGKFIKENNIESDTAFQMTVLTVHGESIRGNLFQETDSTVVFHSDYGVITVVKNLIVETIYLNNKFLQFKNTYTVTTVNGESFDGKLISATNLTATYQTNFGNIVLSNKDIKNVYSASLDNRSLFFGDTFAITMFSGESFDGVLLASTDSSETYQTKAGKLTVSKWNIQNKIMTVCSVPLDNKFLLFGNKFTVTTVSGESYTGRLISATDSSLSYESNNYTVVVLKNNITTVLNASLENKSFKSIYPLTVAMINKESFHGKLKSSTDSTFTYQTNTGNVCVLKRNILTVAETLDDLVSQINRMNVHLPSFKSIYGGLAIPTGDFVRTSFSGGSAKMGYTAGLQYVAGDEIGFLLDASISLNSLNGDVAKDELVNNLQYQYPGKDISVFNLSAGHWTDILLLAGLKYETLNPEGTNFFFAPVIGLDIFVTPKISGDYSYSYYSVNSQGIFLNTLTANVTQNSSNNIAFVYGATAEGIISNYLTINARYLFGTLNYKVTYSDNLTRSFRQNISMLQVCIGVVIFK
jgi:RNase P/RNase MRP subunit p29